MMKSRNVLQSFNYAMQGIVQAVKNERNLKIHLISALGVFALCFIVGVSTIELAIVLMVSGVVIAAELINTSIEAVIDLVCGDKKDPLAKLAKDVAAGAVFVTAVTAMLVGFIIFYDEIDLLLSKKEYYVGLIDSEIAIISLILVTIGIILFKVWTGRESSVLSGGFPSGHSSLAFAGATLVLFMSENTIVTIIAYLLAFLVAQSRVESKIHTTFEVVSGALYGILCVMLIYRIFVL